MNKKRLSILSDMMRRSVDRGECAGVQAMVIHDGIEEYHDIVGLADIEKNRPMTRDAIFRMYSSSKCVTALAAVMCIERGLLALRAPVHEYLPGFKEQTYWNGKEIVPVGIPMLVRDVLTMTSGLSYPSNTVAGKATTALVREMDEKADRGDFTSTVDFANDLGKCPLDFAPGDRWQYGYSADVAGALVEVVTGMSYGEFLQREIFEPLGMKDTGFRVTAAQRTRMATTYTAFQQNGLAPYTRAGFFLGLRDYDERTAFESGGAGLVSTIDDWAQLMRLFQSNGTLGGHRFLSPAGMLFLRAPQLSAYQARTYNWLDCLGQNYGILMNIKTAPGPSSNFCNIGTFGWDGWLGTSSFVDPVENLSLIVLLQNHEGDTSRGLTGAMRPPLYAALDD